MLRGNTTLLEGYDDVSLTVSACSVFAGGNVSLYITRLDDIDFEQSTVGFNWNFNLLPR